MRACIFCGDRAGTLEDAWPLWLMRKFPRNTKGVMEGEIGKGPLLHYKLISPELKVKFICKKCNNGWMSRLENNIKPIIEPLFSNKQGFISPDQQSILSAWAVKTAMVLEAIHPKRRFYLPSECALLMNNLHLPDQTYVWLAICVNHNACFSSASILTARVNDTFNKLTGYCSTLAFGPLVFQVLSNRIIDDSSLKFTLSFDLQSDQCSQATICIWPVQNTPQKWPPKLGLNGDTGLEALRTRWISPRQT